MADSILQHSQPRQEIERTVPASSDILALRAWARARLLLEGEILTVPEAVDPLQRFAERSGLVHRVGQTAVQDVIATAFAFGRST
jgi:hypothetical protein